MKKIVIFFTSFLFVNVQSGFLDQWAGNFNRQMQDFGQSFQNFGEQLSRDLQNQGKIIEQQAMAYAKQAEREQKQREEEFQREQDEIMTTVKQIQAGTTPSGVNSANTTSLTENINGKIITMKTTIYSIGNEKKGTIHTVQVIYEGGYEVDWSINSIIWNGNQVTKRLIQYSPNSGGNNFSINNNGGIVSTSSGGTSIISTNGRRVIVQQINL